MEGITWVPLRTLRTGAVTSICAARLRVTVADRTVVFVTRVHLLEHTAAFPFPERSIRDVHSVR
ncbi:hypothetical protein DBV08_14485 [Rhodococcus sp. KBW08]|nr:hypothetical protein DBV08_14485 [Rhodococcus sp. KBW08]UJC81595.1 hypothetical protein D4768_07010 [Rhodococcus erythropolis]